MSGLSPLSAVIPSGGGIVESVFTSTNGAFATQQFANALQSAGWVVVGAVTNGYRLKGSSPEGLFVYLDVFWTTGLGDQLCAQFHSNDLSVAGFQHQATLRTDVFDGSTNGQRQFRVIANRCQYFLSTPGIHDDGFGSSMCGGIPYVRGVLSESAASQVFEAWWSSGDYISSFFARPCPRTSLGRLSTSTDAYWRSATVPVGSYQDNRGNNGIGEVALFFWAASSNLQVGGQVGSNNSQILWFDGTPLAFTPTIGWGNDNTSTTRLRGLLYDSLILSAQKPMDDLVTLEASAFINYTDQYRYGSLYLLRTPIAQPGSNYCYLR